MTKINREEYEVLKGLDYKWKWIVRDEDESLWVFTVKPDRRIGRISSSCWDAETGRSFPVLELIGETDLFQFIQWEDEEPHNITELIEEYEIENGTRDDFEKIKIIDIDISKLANISGFIYVKESEET